MSKKDWDVIEGMLVPISQIRNHPDNIRKAYNEDDIGDLADSIRSIGLLQPLTVIPEAGHEEELDSFYVVAGNRRLLAAIEAGLANVRCTIICGMSKLEQVEMMLTENMQRKDLSPFEEGEAFQMLLDLGQSEDDISSRTGLSRSTIRHRVEIAKLDRATVERRLSGSDGDFFQLSLGDIMRLEQIGDTAVRNRILGDAKSSEQLAYLVEEEKRRVNREKKLAEAKKVVRETGARKASSGFMSSGRYKVAAFVPYKEKSFAGELKKAIGKAAEDGIVRYREEYGGVTVFAENKPEKPAVQKSREETAAEKYRREEAIKAGDLASEIRDMVSHMRAMVLDVVSGKLSQSMLPDEMEAARLLRGCFRILVREGKTISYASAAAFLEGISSARASYRGDGIEKVRQLPEHLQALLVVGYAIDEEESRGGLFGYGRKYERFRMRSLTDLISLLSRYGCALTDEEMLLAWGRSTLYSNPEKPGDTGEGDEDPGLWRSGK